MIQYKRIGIDTSKAVFTLHGIDQQDRPVLRINLRRAQMISFFTTRCGFPGLSNSPARL
jgi:transposase